MLTPHATLAVAYPGFDVTAKSVANKGEPFQSGIDDTPEAVQQFVGLHGFRLQQHLGPRQVDLRAWVSLPFGASLDCIITHTAVTMV